MRNITAVCELSEIVRTSFGPNGTYYAPVLQLHLHYAIVLTFVFVYRPEQNGRRTIYRNYL